MTKYEYKVIEIRRVDYRDGYADAMTQLLNDYNDDGWELIGHVEVAVPSSQHSMHLYATMRREK